MKQTIIAVVVDTQGAQFYNKLGDTIYVEQGDHRLAALMEISTAPLSVGQEVELDFSDSTPNHYKDYEDTSSGIVKFFRVAKNVLKKLFSDEYANDIPPVTLGRVPNEDFFDSVPETQTEKNTRVVAEIMLHAQPASSENFLKESPTTEIVAVVNEKIIPNVESILPQVANSVKVSNTVGLDKFMERLSKVTDQRSHSVQDLMKFMSKADLPIADDGSIIIYKVLKTLPNKEGFFDCHTGRINQKVGSYVHMDQSLVDPNRSNECSNGLHVARRGYLANFSGNVLVLAKVAPEDVIAVPKYDSNKMRVCGYHIIFQLSKEDHEKLKQNKPMTDSMEAAQLLAKAISGNHVSKLESVRITEHLGKAVTTTSLVKVDKIKEELKLNIVKESDKQAHAINTDVENQISAEPVKIDQILAVVTQEREKLEPTTKEQQEEVPETRAEIVHKLMLIVKGKRTPMEQTQAKDAIKAIKKKSKVSWERLGISLNDVKTHFSK